ncbi:MAG: CoA transferase, partial [Bradyrhizobium sp.]
LDLTDLPADPRFVTNGDRHRHREALIPLLQAAFARKPAAHWLAALREVNVPIAVVNTLDLAFSDPQVVHRRMVEEIVAEDGRRIGVTGNPIKVDGVTTDAHYPPRLGEDTRSVLRDVLALDDDRIARLLENGAIGELSAPAAE